MVHRLPLAAALAALLAAPSFGAPQHELGDSSFDAFFKSPSAPLPPDVYCQIDGFDITRAAYGDWLQLHRGDLYIREYVTAFLVRRAAREKNVATTPEEVAAEIERRIEERTVQAYRGNRDLFVREELTAFGKTIDEFRKQQSWDVETELLVDKILKASRLTTDADVEKEFRRLYGASGRELWLRAILIEIDVPPVTSLKPKAEIDAMTQKAIEEARRKGVTVVKRLQAGELDFASAALAYSDDASSKTKGGDIGKYVVTPFEFGEEFDKLIQKAKPGQTVGPVRINAGFVIAEITKEVQHDLDSERAALRDQMKNRRPTLAEIQEFVGGLVASSRRMR